MESSIFSTSTVLWVVFLGGLLLLIKKLHDDVFGKKERHQGQSSDMILEISSMVGLQMPPPRTANPNLEPACDFLLEKRLTLAKAYIKEMKKPDASRRRHEIQRNLNRLWDDVKLVSKAQFGQETTRKALYETDSHTFRF